jgi:hypothetical protein
MEYGIWNMERGNILPLALVVMTAILLAGVGLGIVVLDSLQRTADVDASMVAYYTADGGIERQIYDLRKSNFTLTQIASEGGTQPSISGASWATATSTFTQITSKVFPVVLNGEFQFVDLYNPDQINAAAGVGRVDFSWGAGTDCAGGVPPQMEMGYSEWSVTGTVLPTTFTILHASDYSGSNQPLDSSKAYRLRFRPKGCSATNLKVEVSPTVATYAPKVFPGDITLGSIGTYKNARQAITVVAPRQDVLSGVFTYVLFSECQLYKDPTNPSPPTCP